MSIFGSSGHWSNHSGLLLKIPEKRFQWKPSLRQFWPNILGVWGGTFYDRVNTENKFCGTPDKLIDRLEIVDSPTCLNFSELKLTFGEKALYSLSIIDTMQIRSSSCGQWDDQLGKLAHFFLHLLSCWHVFSLPIEWTLNKIFYFNLPQLLLPKIWAINKKLTQINMLMKAGKYFIGG